MAQILVEHTFGHGALVEEFGPITVTVEPDRETLGRIFGAPRIKRLDIELTPPNALDRVERRLLKCLHDQNATTYSQSFQSTHPEGLKVDQDGRNVAEIAKSNGHVSATVENDVGKVDRLSTLDHPLSERIFYEQSVTPPRDALIAESDRILIKVVQDDDLPGQ